MAHPRWRAGKLSTGFIAEEYPGGFHPRSPEGDTARVMAAVATVIDDIGNARKRGISGQLESRDVRFAQRRVVMLGTASHMVEVRRRDGATSVTFFDDGAAGQAVELSSSWKPGDLVWSGTVDGALVAVQVHPVANGFELSCRGFDTRALVYTEDEAAAARLMPEKKLNDSGKKLLCPMPGLVVSIAVREGQEVKAGETLAVVEAMKMENVLRAERDGTIKSIKAKPGESLAVDQVILEFA